MEKNKLFNYIINDTASLYDEKKFKFLRNKEILIAGATGVLGNYFISFFLSSLKSKNKPKSITLVYKSDLPDYLKFLKKIPKIKLVKKDLEDLVKLKIKKQDFIIYLTGYGQPSKFIKDPLKTYKINTTSLEFFINKIKAKGRFLFLSTSEIYSGLSGKISENKVGNTNTDHPRACYIESKRGGETLLNLYKNKINFHPISARLCLAYGPGVKKNDERVLHQFINKALKFKKIKMLDNGKALRSYIYVSDAVRMLINILFFGKKSLYNIGGKKIISIKNLAKKISKILNVKFELPKKIKNKKFGKPPKNAYVDIKNYEIEFGKFKLLNIEEGLKRTIEWQKKL
jgi:nucleoside-diphosphate-sugar epimerase